MGQLGTQGIGVELHFDAIPYVQIGVGANATFEKERGRVFARGRLPVGHGLQLLAGLAYNRGYFQENSACGFLDHSCNNEVLLEGPIRSVQPEASFNFTGGHLRISLLAGIERLTSEPICRPGTQVCLVEKTTFHIMVGIGYAF